MLEKLKKIGKIGKIGKMGKIKKIIIPSGIIFIALACLLTMTVFAESKLVFIDKAPFFAFETTETITEVMDIPYGTAESPDNEMERGKTVLLSDGVLGEKQIEYKITKVNGVPVQIDVVSETMNAAPVDEVRAVGVKEEEKKASTGTYRRPYFGIISSRFGARWGRQHTGIDYSGKMGDPINAADGGTVIFAGTDGGYGIIVKISHENGYETWYGHMSEFTVKKGQTVAKGDLIGKIGNTGNSTGPHLHFEVRKNGVPQNPETYVGGQ